MQKTIAIAMIAPAAVLASPAFAEPFDGPYAGVEAGYSRDQISRGIEGTPVDARVTKDDAAAGFFVGYNYRVADRFVVGAEGGMLFTIDDKLPAASNGDPLQIDPRYSFNVSARAGYLVTPKTLVYARGGYANARTRLTASTATGPVRDDRNIDGWQVGGGVERSIADHISARIEYRYSDLGRDGGRYDRHQVLMGVAYNF